MATLPELLGVLRNKVGFEVVRKDVDNTRVHLVGRIRGQTIANALVLTRRLLSASKRTSEWTIDVSQAYELKGSEELLVKGWRIIIQSADMTSALDRVIGVVRHSPVARQPEVDTIPLPGATADRNMPNNRGKGAAVTGQAIIGRR